MNRKSKSILKNLLISYAVIMLIYVAAWSVMQMKAVSILKKQTDTIYTDMLTVLSGVVDSEVSDIKRVSVDIAMDPAIVALMDGFRRGDPYDAYKIRMVREKLYSVKSNAWSIENIYLYVKKPDKVVSDTTAASGRLYFDHYLMNLDLTYEAWEAQLWGLDKNGYHIFRNKDKSNSVVFFRHLPVGKSPGQSEGMLAIVFSTTAMESHIHTLQEDENIKIDILTEQGEPVISTGLEKTDDYQTIERVSEQTGWTYRTYVPLTSFRQQENLFVMLALGMIGSATVMGIIIIYYSMRKNYMPLKELINRMQKSMENDGISENEVDYLWNSFRLLADKQKHDEARLNRQMTEMESLFIGQLFHGRAVSSKSEEDYLQLFKLQFVKAAFVVIKITPDDAQEQRTEGILEGDGIYREGRQIFAGGRTIEKGDHFYLLDASEYAVEEFTEALELFQLSFPCKIVMSAVHRGCEEISQAYSEVLGTDGYADMTGTGRLIVYSGDILQGPNWQSDYGAAEKKLVNAVCARQRTESAVYLDQIWELIYREGPISVGEIKFLFMGLLNIILNDSKDSETRKIILDCSKKIRFISGNGAVSGIKDISYETIEALCREVKEESSKEQQLKQQVLAFIDCHFAEEELSVNSICREMERSASSVMKVFENGNGVLYYINERRILEAKRMILEQNGQVGIVRVAESVGYANQNTFIRVFKKYEGITPGKFCELVKRLEQDGGI